MKRRLIGFVGFVFLAIITASPTFSQNRTLSSAAGDKWVITAKAGGVNYVQGDVNITRETGKSGLLLKGDAVDVGDQVSTGANGRVEMLLNPGSYLRVDENSAFQFKTTDLEDLQIQVTRGSVMLEVFAANDFKVAVSTPKQNYDLVDTGIYRVDVAADGNARIEVWKGKVEVGDAVLKGGRAGSGLDGQFAVAKFDRDERDSFETWSRDRAKELAKATDSLRDKTLRTSLMQSFLGGRWNMYNSFGLWVYDPRFGGSCFLPFGYGWASPYGFGFRADIGWYNLPRAVYYPPVYRAPSTGNPPTGGTRPPAGTPPRQTPPTGTPPADRRPIGQRKREPMGDPDTRRSQGPPPFVRMQGTSRGTGPDVGYNPRGRSSGNGGGGMNPSRSTPTFEPSRGLPSVTPRMEPSSPRMPRGGSGDIAPIRGKGNN